MVAQVLEGAGFQYSSSESGTEPNSADLNALPAGEGKAEHQQHNDRQGVKAARSFFAGRNRAP